MDDAEDDAKRYNSKPYSVNYRSSYASSSQRSKKIPVQTEYYEVEEEEEEEEEEGNGVQQIVEQAEEDEDDQRHRKKRKFKSLGIGFEFAPHVVEPLGGRNSSTEWAESETFVLLDVWGDRFVQLGRKSLRSEDWIEVAKRVSELSKTVRTDTQCRNCLDNLKKRYKVEKMKLGESGSMSSKWVYFERMDKLMELPPQQSGLSCGVDSGEYVFMNPKFYLNRANGLDEMRDSPENSESAEGDEDDLPKKGRMQEDGDEGSSYRLLAHSIQNFGKIYEKIENNKRKHMLELEKMRMEFQRDLELQTRQILDRAQAEIEKLQEGDDGEDEDDDDDDDDDGDEEIDVCIENVSE